MARVVLYSRYASPTALALAKSTKVATLKRAENLRALGALLFWLLQYPELTIFTGLEHQAPHEAPNPEAANALTM